MDFTAPYAEGKLKRNKPLALDEFEFLKGITSATPKVSCARPFGRCRDVQVTARPSGPTPTNMPQRGAPPCR